MSKKNRPDAEQYETKDMTRAKRREHKKRVGRKMFKVYHGFDPNGPIPTEASHMFWYKSPEAFAGVYGNTRTPCSCAACGNPRKFWGHVTRQEIRAEDDARCQDLCPECVEEELNQDTTEEEKEALEYGRKMGYIK